MMKKLLALAAMSTLCLTMVPAQAQSEAASATKKDLIGRILKLQQPGIEILARSLAERPAAQLMQQVAPALQRLPADKREATARDIEADVRKYAESVVPGIQAKAVKLAPSTLGTIMEERLTEEELREVLSILESPVNRKFQSMSGDMQRAISEKLVAESRGDIEPKLRAMEQSVAKRLGITAKPPVTPKQ